MPKLLVVDPLNLVLRKPDGSMEWSSKSCFTRSLDSAPALICKYIGASDPQLCRLAKEADGVILGGSEASAWEDSSFNDQLLDLIAICRNHEIPLLAICFGAQLLGRALGGHVAPHPEGIELGAPQIRISKKGREHFLFEGFESGSFRAIATHNDAVLTLPQECVLLASTEHTPVQAFSFRDLLTGVQFHPEMDGEDLRRLWEAFLRTGVVDEISPERQRILDACECERLDRLIDNFVRRVGQGRAVRTKV